MTQRSDIAAAAAAGHPMEIKPLSIEEVKRLESLGAKMTELYCHQNARKVKSSQY